MDKKKFKFLVLILLVVLGIAVFYSNVVRKPQSELYISGVGETIATDQDVSAQNEIPSQLQSGHVSKITIGMTAPDFSLPDANGEVKKLSDYLQEGPVILSFYRGGWCPICNDQLYAYQQILPEFEEIGGQLVAVSPEKPESIQDTKVRNNLSFDVLSDAGNNVARLYDLIWQIPEDKREEFSKWLDSETGKTLAQYNGVDNYELPIPATFVIARDGKVAFVFRDEDYTKRANNDDILEALKNLEEPAEPTE